jgi:multicomponent Na+:H+ antiporter subunit D
MMGLSIIWLVLPLMAGFIIYLLPKGGKGVAMGIAIASCVYGLTLIFSEIGFDWVLLDNFGVTLRLDTQSGFFILTNGWVTAAVIAYSWYSNKSAYFFTQLSILHGSLNAVFACADLMSLYVSLECISIAVFLLITYQRQGRTIWVALRYLFVSNTAMLFYLLGAVLVYQESNSFAFSALTQAPADAIALILLGLLTKGGVFISGLWLPITHSESEAAVSALLSGVAIKAGIFPLLRLAPLLDSIDIAIRVFGVGTAFLGAFFAIFEKDIKRIFALSTVSQMGFILAAPQVGGFYALGHGVAKATLFLSTKGLPSRHMDDLQQKPMSRSIWMLMAIAGLSIAGAPLLVGFAAKALTLKSLQPWQTLPMNIAAVGTAIVFARLIFLPHQPQPEHKMPRGFWAATLLLASGLVAANGFYYQAYTLNDVIKSLVVIALGWLTYWVICRRFTFNLPDGIERLEHLIGVMSLMLIGLFTWVLV